MFENGDFFNSDLPILWELYILDLHPVIFSVCWKNTDFFIFSEFSSFFIDILLRRCVKTDDFHDFLQISLVGSGDRAKIIEKKTKIRKNKKFSIFPTHTIYN